MVATTAQEKVELLEAELLKTQSEAATLRNVSACERSLEDRSTQSATLANKDREIERLLDQVANLQRAVHESENSVEQRLRAERDVAKALRAQLDTTGRSLREFEERYGRDGWGDIPITIYGLSPKNPNVRKAKGQPPINSVNINIRLGHMRRVFQIQCVHWSYGRRLPDPTRGRLWRLCKGLSSGVLSRRLF